MIHLTILRRCAILLAALFLLSIPCRAPAKYIADGVSLKPLTADGKSQVLAWAYQGDWILFVREIANSQRQLCIMRSDGSGQETVTPIGNPFYGEWAWSGARFAYLFSNANDDESQGGAFVYDVMTKKTLPVSAPHRRGSLDEDEGPLWSADESLVAYKVRVGPSLSREVWIADTRKGQFTRLLSDRGEVKEAHWSLAEPSRLCLQVQASGDYYDIATVRTDGSDFHMFTQVGTQSLSGDEPRWSPDGKWVAYYYDQDMTPSEREEDLKDLWIAKPDGSETRNLTKASTPVTENQINLDEEILWSWDGRWILCAGNRRDKQKNEIPALYLIDPVNGGYRILLTSHPETQGEHLEFRSVKWSYDSAKLAILARRAAAKNWGPDVQFESKKDVLLLYDLQQDKLDDLLVMDQELDRMEILGSAEREDLADISWSPDNRSIALTIAKVISKGQDIMQPDVYRLDLPDQYVASSVSGLKLLLKGDVQPAAPAKAPETVAPAQGPAAKPATEPAGAKDATSLDPKATVTEAIVPVHLTATEVMDALAASLKSCLTVSATHNTLIFIGPRDSLKMVRDNIAMIDRPATHLLVDMLAVELSDQANRNLGLDWTYAEGRFGLYMPEGNAIRDLAPDARVSDRGLQTIPGLGQGFYSGVDKLPREFFVRLNLLVKDGEATILANPRTVSLSGKESLIEIRKTVNFFFNEGFDEAGRPIVKKSDITAETVGRITPVLLEDGRIHLIVNVSVGSFTFSEAEQLPEQTSRKSTTEVTVHEGDTIVIGGLRQQERVYTLTRVPILGSIPLIKPLFTKKETTIKHSVLTIFITPQILKEGTRNLEWPRLENGEFQITPIMDRQTEETIRGRNDDRGKNDGAAPKSSSPDSNTRSGKIKRWFRGLFDFE